MKKGDIIEGVVVRYDYPGTGILMAEGREVKIKGVLPGQTVRCRIKKANLSKCEAMLLEVIRHSEDENESCCPHFPECGGCQMQTLPYDRQLAIKSEQVRRLLEDDLIDPADGWFEGIYPSPDEEGYRNKMEFTFGDSYKGGPLVLGMHRKGSFYDIVDTEGCRIVDDDIRSVRTAVLGIARETSYPYYHRLTHIGFYRHLLVRKARSSGQILVDLVTTTQYESDAAMDELDRKLVETLCSLKLRGTVSGILHTYNDSVADVIQSDRTELLYGTDRIEEKLLGLDFIITPFSFFQTNSGGAEVLYDTVRRYISEEAPSVERGSAEEPSAQRPRADGPSAEISSAKTMRAEGSMDDSPDGKVIFDLYSGTGTIAQILAPAAGHVTGVEIVGEAVEAARENAKRNKLANCGFICGDVLKVIDSLDEKPDLIVLDPPRDGIHPKAMPKILKFGVDRIVYISCKATSLKRDLVPLQMAGYRVERLSLTDLFPGTAHVECIALMTKERG